MHYVYILRCSDRTLYTGYTNRLEERVNAHNAGKGAKYTRGRGPVVLVYYESYDYKSEALKREYAFKKFSREKKVNLINNWKKK